MCGRTSLKASPEEIAEAFGLDAVPDLSARYNIAPTQPMPVVWRGRESKKRELHLVRFGLIPFWEREPTSAARHVNARAETVLTARPFAQSAKKRRCLVVCDGFYEWKHEEGKKKRVPYRIHFEGDAPFALAGVWDRWVAPDGEVVESCAIVTGPARGVVAPLHDRMPLLVPRERYDAWLDREHDPAALLHEMTEATPAWTADRISAYVNDPRHEGPECFAADNDAQPELFAASPHRGGSRQTE